ncbi:membrane protein insertase YidC [Leptospira sp. GIMC2001]|uniref:membrane protein insertase YidC n=1 Tax=Leptospira sp. GIMC2001 TaxID=1513297 RepID=UPI00234971AC|nr:membrane protein insertase YidC [Leptospira sp. GIMC2001]WCL49007.1 membrane protein insertase YidC [Leptospira sp. GIMC2001]
MQDRQGRLFLALFLSLGIWMGIQYVFFPPEPITKQDESAQSDALTESQEAEKAAENPKKSEIKPVVSADIKPVDPSSVKKFYIKTAPYLIELSSLGGKINQFYIKNHKEPDGTELQIVKDPDKHTIEFDGEKYQAIEISRGNGFDFNPIFDKENIPSSDFNGINFAGSFDKENLTITFEGLSLDKSYLLRKIFKFFPDENYFSYKMEIVNRSNNVITLADKKRNLYFRSFGSLGPVTKAQDDMSDRDMANFFRYYYLDGSFKDYLDGTTTEGFFSNFFGSKPEDNRFEIQKGTGEGLDFAGTGSRYFIAVLDPLGENKPDGVLLDNRAKNRTGVLMIYDSLVIEPGKSESFDYAAYVGIREADGMAFRDPKIDPKQNKQSIFVGLSDALDKSFNQGLTTPFRNGIVWILKKIYTYVIPNYGWGIIIFAILFKLAFFPLNQKQAESMKKMQELSPQIKEINEKYEKDPQVKQQKIMELYKKNKVNPMGGCLPMLIQIPIFIALYTAFSDTVDLWESPFLWVNDLSEPDTIYQLPAMFGMGGLNINALPLVMVGSQFLQSRLTVSTADPNQKMMMYFMPVIMLYFFWAMPAGVTLYWTMQNILSILQQLWTNKFGKDAKLKKLSDSGDGKASNLPSANNQKPAVRRTPPPRGRRKK